MIEGRLQTRSWEGQDGVKRYRTEIVAENLQLGPKPFGKEGIKQFPSKDEQNAKPQKEDIPVVNEDQPSTESDVEESEVQLKDVPF